MIKKCPYCQKQVDMADISESGQYECPYADCSKTFLFNKDTAELHKIVEATEEAIEDKIIFKCQNPDCGQMLRIPKNTSTLQVTCPQCSMSFRYPEKDKVTPHDISELLGEFNKALDDEIKAVKTRGGDRTLVLKDGKFIREIVGEGVYQFNLERKIPVADETPAQIEIMGKNYRASIVRFSEFKLEVRITDFDDNRISFALLKIDATYVLRKLKDALSLLSYRSEGTNLALKVFNRISSNYAVAKPVFTLFDENGNSPDNFQSKAIETCLSNEVSFIHGPPGTGKTRTLVNVINDLANNGKKVLVACHTNIACDNVIEHFIGYGHEKTVECLLRNGEIVRIGTPVMKSREISALTLEAIYENLSKGLLAEKDNLTSLMQSLIQKNRKYYEYKQILLECEKESERITRCEENIYKTKEIIKQYTRKENELNQIILKRERLLSIAEKRSVIINFLKRTMPKPLISEIANFNNLKTESIKNRNEKDKLLGLLSNEKEKLDISLSEKFVSVPKGIKIDDVKTGLGETEIEIKVIKSNIENVDDRISKLNEGVLSNAKIIVSTLAKTFIDTILINMRFDVIVVDEASIAPLPTLFYVCSLANEKVLIFGDPQQLSPIKLANTIATDRWLKNDIFQEADTTRDSPYDRRTSTLKNNYRMHGEIFEIVNNKFYNNDLINRRQKIDLEYHKYNNLIPKPECRVVIIDTSNANACMSTEKVGPKSWSRYNLYHIQILKKILLDLVNCNNIENKEIGIITPYRSQAGFIREVLKELGLEKVIDLGTVHSFQGVERKYIIFDLVEAPGGKKVGVLVNDKHDVYIGKKQSENSALRLLTVAFSRPREKLLIISHNRYMLRNLPGNSVLRNIISDLTDRQAIIDGSELVPYYVPIEEHPNGVLFSEEKLSGKTAMFNQRSFYPNLIQDLKNAKKDVIIISGYMSVNRIEKIMPYFTDLLSKSVTIKIFTKPPREQMSREQELKELHNRLINMGIEIYQHYGTHEKIVAIDGHILYEGSCNILSFNHRTGEVMTRFDGKSILQKMLSVLIKNHPRLEDYLIKTGYVGSEQVVDLTPEKFQNILDSVRPKHREIPKGKKEVKEYYRSMFVKLRWVIADDKRFPNFAILFNKTIETMLNNPPSTIEQLLSLPEFIRNKTNIKEYENIVLKILNEYKEVLRNN